MYEYRKWCIYRNIRKSPPPTLQSSFSRKIPLQNVFDLWPIIRWPLPFFFRWIWNKSYVLYLGKCSLLKGNVYPDLWSFLFTEQSKWFADDVRCSGTSFILLAWTSWSKSEIFTRSSCSHSGMGLNEQIADTMKSVMMQSVLQI